MFRNPTTDVIVVLVIVLLFFGPKRLPLLGRELGRGMREFRDSITGKDKDAEDQPAITQASESPDLAAVTAPERTPADAGPERRS
jgi:sec-independent protein translocase protein TatA